MLKTYQDHIREHFGDTKELERNNKYIEFQPKHECVLCNSIFIPRDKETDVKQPIICSYCLETMAREVTQDDLAKLFYTKSFARGIHTILYHDLEEYKTMESRELHGNKVAMIFKPLPNTDAEASKSRLKLTLTFETEILHGKIDELNIT